MSAEYNTKNSLKNYIDFQESNVMIADSKGASFVKSFINDDSVIEIIALKKDGAKDEWANRPVFLASLKDGNPIIKSISVVDMALNGYQKYVDKSLVTEDLKKYGQDMKRWHGLCFKPGTATTKKYNLFKGFPIEPIQEDISIFIKFLEIVIGKESSIVLDYFAHMFQKPKEKPRFALIFKGGKGVGKNTIEEMLGRGLLRTENYYRTSNQNQFFGKFNAHLQQNLLTVMQELVWGGSDDYDSILKDMITERERAVEKKYVDQEMMDNYSRILMTTNAKWAVPANGKDERRYCIITFPDEKPKVIDTSFFNTLYKWYDNGGKEALMYEMLNRDISNFSIDKAPYTKGLSEQLSYSLNGIEKFCAEGLRNGYFGRLHKSVGNNQKYAYCYASETLRIKRKDLYECFLFNYKDSILESQTSFHKRMEELLGCNPKKQSDANYTQFLPIEKSVEKFTEATNVIIECEPNTWYKQVEVEEELKKMELLSA